MLWRQQIFGWGRLPATVDHIHTRSSSAPSKMPSLLIANQSKLYQGSILGCRRRWIMKLGGIIVPRARARQTRTCGIWTWEAPLICDESRPQAWAMAMGYGLHRMDNNMRILIQLLAAFVEVGVRSLEHPFCYDMHYQTETAGMILVRCPNPSRFFSGKRPRTRAFALVWKCLRATGNRPKDERHARRLWTWIQIPSRVCKMTEAFFAFQSRNSLGAKQGGEAAVQVQPHDEEKRGADKCTIAKTA